MLLPSASSCRPRIIGGQSQSKDLWKGKEGLAIHKEIILPKSWNSGHGWLGVSNHLENVVSLHGPGKIKDIISAFGNVNFLSIRQNNTLSRGDTPNNGNVVFFTTAIRSGLSGRQGVEVSKTESPRRAIKSKIHKLDLARRKWLLVAFQPYRHSIYESRMDTRLTIGHDASYWQCVFRLPLP